MSKVAIKNTKLFYEEEASDMLEEVMLFNHDDAKRIQNRLELFDDENTREFIAKMKSSGLTNEEVEELLEEACEDGNKEAQDKVKEISGMEMTKTTTFAKFMESPLFTSLGIKIESPNDHFILGLIWARFLNKDSMMNKLKEAVVKIASR